jgi:hypothetical protein
MKRYILHRDRQSVFLKWNNAGKLLLALETYGKPTEELTPWESKSLGQTWWVHLLVKCRRPLECLSFLPAVVKGSLQLTMLGLPKAALRV